MIDVTPIIYSIKRGLGFDAKKLQDIAKRTEILCPEEQEIIRPAIFLKDNLNLISGFAPYTVPDDAYRVINGGEVTHAPTILYEIDHIKFLKGTFYKDMLKYPVTLRPTKKIIFSKPEFINKAAFISTACGTNYFGHWLTDDVPQILLGNKYADVFGYSEKTYFHSKEYLEIFNLDLQLTSNAIFESVVLFQDYSQNSLKRKRYFELRQLIRKHVNNKLTTTSQPLSNKSNNKRIYVKRGSSGERRGITNEEEIIKHLESVGFIIIEPEKLTPNELITITLDASMVIGCEGSHMTHFIYTIAQNGCKICLTHPNRVSIILKGYADCIGYYYGIVIGQDKGNDFSIKISDLDKVIELYNSKTLCYAETN